jgi:hypothetical protein
MDGQRGTRVRVLSCGLAAVAAAVAWAGAVAPAWPAVHRIATGHGIATGGPDASSVGTVRLAGSWGRAIEVPGLAALAKGAGADVDSVSCGAAGNCVAGGGTGNELGFVAVERHGRWGHAIEVPGLAALVAVNPGGGAGVASVSCASAGNCAVGGDYWNRYGEDYQGFVADERNGVWGQAIEVPGLAALNKHSSAGVYSVSCGSAGNCAVGGSYEAAHLQGFVADERKGAWGQAIEVPGQATLNAGGGDARVLSLSCGAAGDCAAGGWYTSHGFRTRAFVAVEKNGRWRRAIEVPGLEALTTGEDAEVDSVSCGSAGSCAVGGSFDGRHGQQGFVAAERHGVWGRAIEVPGLAALDIGGGAEVNSVSCAQAGNCAAGGDYWYRNGKYYRGFVATERNGRWSRAIDVPGLSALDVAKVGEVDSVSCGSAGNCAAVGQFGDHAGLQGFVVVEWHGRWGKAIEVPGLSALNKGGYAEVNSVSCALAGTCAAGGSFSDRHGHSQGFVVTRPRRPRA